MRGILLLLMLAGSSWAQTTLAPLSFYQACFGGVDTYHDSARIDNCDFQDGRNFLTDRGYLEKRPGSFRVSDGLKPGYPITYQNEFVNVSNNDRLLVQASTQIFSGDFGTAFVEIATVNVRGVTSSVSAFGKHFFVNGYDVPWYTTGTDYVAVPEIPGTCRHVLFEKERLWCADNSTVYASAYGDYTDWTIPTLLTADSPTSWTFDVQDGKVLTGMYASPYGVLVWKRTKTFIVKGNDNDDFYKFRLSDNIGCVDVRTVQTIEGRVTWLGEEGVYQWSGGNEAPVLVSKEITPVIKTIRQTISNTNARSVTTPEDFRAGLITKNGPSDSWSTYIAQGAITPSTYTHVDSTGTDWNAGTQFQADTVTYTNQVAIGYEQFSRPTVLTNPIWTGTALGPCTEGGVFYATVTAQGTLATSLANDAVCATTSTLNVGTWEFDYKLGATSGNSAVYFMAGPWPNGHLNAYWIKLLGPAASPTTSAVTLQKTVGGVTTQLGICGIGQLPYNEWVHYTVTRSSIGVFHVGALGTGINCGIAATDTSILTSTSTIVRLDVTEVGGTPPPEAWDEVDNLGYVKLASATWTSSLYDTSFATNAAGSLAVVLSTPIGTDVQFAVRSSSTNVLPTYSAWATPTVAGLFTSSMTLTVPSLQRFVQYQMEFTTNVTSQTPTVSNVTLNTVSTGTWDSAVLFVGTDITSWGQFISISNVSTADSVLYYVRSHPTGFNVDSTTIPWVTQPNNLEVTASTNPYVQVRVVSNISAVASPATVFSVTLNWFEGEVPRAASLYYDHKYLLAVSISTGVPSNDTTLVLQRTGKWSIFDGLSYGTLGLYNVQPYAGSGLTDSKIWRIMKEDVYYDDNDKAIDAYVVTKDFQFDGQNNVKVLRNLYVEAAPGADSTLSMAYSVDKSTTYYSTSKALSAGQVFNDEVKDFFPGFAKGRYARFKFSNAVVNEPLRLDAYTILGDVERLYRR